jgi:hypothetical protein
VAIIIVPDDYATISLAVAAAVAGDEIQVKSGTYAESVLVDSKAHITLTGVDLGTGYPVIAPAANTHPTYDCAAIILNESDFATINNLVLNNSVGGGEKNYGILIRSSSDLVIQGIEATSLKSAVVIQTDGVKTCQRLVFGSNNFHDITYTRLTEGFGIDDQGATQNEVTLTNNTFKNLQYGVGFNPLNAAGIVGKYVVTDNVFDTVAQIGLAVECNEGGGTNTATILAYRNVFLANTVANMHFSETTVSSVLNTPSPQIYCWKNIARLGIVGNYYSTHVGVDANDDGIFDNSEIVSAHHIDNAPLFHQWGVDYTSCQRIRGYVYNASATTSDNVPVPMSGVTVLVVDPLTGATQTAVTNASGYYYFALPPLGTGISIQVNVNGFVIAEVTKTVELISNLPVDFYLWNVHRYNS